ncbi:winged helix-turn-helix domain-containing protein [Caulobacter sp. CCNWLY153]|uniref:ATP-binding protein n=1 Tax=unclassified Caulobacter TaxID=2648921 RepID=UPI002FEEC4A2
MPPSTVASSSLAFGPFTLDRERRLLSAGGRPVTIGSRALDILLALIDADGDLLSKDQLLARVWADVVVDESTLRVHIAGLRKALGDGRDGARYVLNEQGRGYRFVAPVTRPDGEPAASQPAPFTPARARATARRIVGRDAIVDSLVHLLPERGFMTVIGPGGIGKTTVATAVAERVAQARGLPWMFIDLAPVAQSELVAGTAAAALDLPGSGRAAEAAVVARLAQVPTVLVLDNCEHVVDAAADLAQAIHQGAPATLVLATSREALRAEGEWVHRLQTLPAPEDGAIDARAAAGYPAVQLFVERARASDDAFALTDANAAAVAEICRRLDGMPLALELAAARIDMMSAAELAANLDDRFDLLTKGRRTALPRQQTLRATLDWSYGLLPAEGRAVLDRLSLFAGAFPMEAARSVAADQDLGRHAVLDIVTALARKSLLSVDASGPATLYRLLDTTRAYARETLAARPDAGETARRHAEYCCAQLADTDSAWEGRARREWLAEKSRLVDDVRAALSWAFSPTGDLPLAIRLTVVSAPLWFHLSLPSEFLALVETALKSIAATDLAGSAAEVELLSAQGHALWHTRGPTTAMESAFARALQIAEALDDPALRLRAGWGRWAHAILAGRYADCAVFADGFQAIAQAVGDPAALQTADHMQALRHHFAGDQETALRLVERVIATHTGPVVANQANHAQVNDTVAAQALKMRILWLRGESAQALRLAQETAEAALATDHDLTICYGLAVGAVPVALWTGRADLARHWADRLLERARGRGVRFWELWGQGYLAALDPSVRVPADAFPMQVECFAAADAGLVDEAMLARLDQEPSTWAGPELMRLGAITGDPAERKASLHAALDLSRAQGAGAWSLRTAISLAEPGRVSEALEALPDAPGCPDRQAARALLDAS